MKEDITSFFHNINITNVYLVFFTLVIFEILCVIISSSYISKLSSKPLIIDSIIDDSHVIPINNRLLFKIYANGDEYLFYKKSYSNKSFGLINDYNWDDLKTIILSSKNLPVHIKYVQTSSNSRLILGLTINGVDYIEYESAKSDHLSIRLHERTLSIIFLIFTILIFVYLFFVYYKIIS